MKRIRWTYGTWVVALLMLLPVACDAPMDDNTGTADDAILFYVKQQVVEGAASRTIVDDTYDLTTQRLPIYVYDEQNHFTAGTEVPYYGNGVWRKDGLKWQDSEYVLYAYVQSAGTGSAKLTISGNGQTVRITQPDAYSNDPKAWADYLLSYRIAAKGADRPLVQLELERVTAAVELYVSFQSSTAHAAQVTGITFSGVKYAGTMTLSRHATPSDQPMEDTGMRNVWGCQPSGAVTSYTHEAVPITVTGFNGTDDQKYDEKYRVMRFLTIPQNLTSDNTLQIYYEVQQTENGGWETYSAAFDLSQFAPGEWTIGHKTRYRLNIDTSVQLEGIVEKWNTTSYIEGTFLPD